MAVLDPLKIVITNYPEGKTELLEIENNPEDESMGKREMPFSREIYIEKSDFMEDPPKKYFRLKPGGEVRLKAGYIIKCEEVVKDENGVIAEVRCTYDPDTKSGSGEMRKVKGTLHWVSAEHAIDSEVRLYDRLFLNEDPEDVPEGLDYKSTINPESLKTVIAKLEPSLADAKPMDKFQFQRMGYFCVDKASTSEKQVYNRTVTLRDSWAKMNK